MHIWQDDLITEPIEIAGGYATVPAGPGLGVTLDEAAVERLRLPDQQTLPTRPRRLYTVSWPAAQPKAGPAGPSGKASQVASGSVAVAGFEHDLFREYDHGNLPRFATGAVLAQRDDDGSAEFAQAFAGARGEGRGGWWAQG